MSFLLDTDICSAYIKGNPAVTNRFVHTKPERSPGLKLEEPPTVSAITVLPGRPDWRREPC